MAADLHRGVVLLSALYGDAKLADPASLPLPDSEIPDTGSLAAARAQGVLKQAAIRRAVELHAEDTAEIHFEGLGWHVQRVGPQKLGYDLDCVDADGASLHVEVKGTQGLGQEVFLTRNEASHNGGKAECRAEHALYVLSGIEVHGTHAIKCTGGIPHCIQPWTVDPAALAPTVYAYRVPGR